MTLFLQTDVLFPQLSPILFPQTPPPYGNVRHVTVSVGQTDCSLKRRVERRRVLKPSNLPAAGVWENQPLHSGKGCALCSSSDLNGQNKLTNNPINMLLAGAPAIRREDGAAVRALEAGLTVLPPPLYCCCLLCCREFGLWPTSRRRVERVLSLTKQESKQKLRVDSNRVPLRACRPVVEVCSSLSSIMSCSRK